MSSCDEINALAEKLCPEFGFDFQLCPFGPVDSEDEEPVRMVIKARLQIKDEIAFTVNEEVDSELFRARLGSMFFRITEMLFEANTTYADTLVKHLNNSLAGCIKEATDNF